MHFHQFALSASVGLVLAGASLSHAQESTILTTTATTTDGTVSNFTPDSVIVQTASSTQPITYSYSKTTSYTDEKGNPVSVETVRSGLPVTVYYTQDGNRFVANKVMVRKTVTTTTVPAGGSTPVVVEKKTTTTTTTQPATIQP